MMFVSRSGPNGHLEVWRMRMEDHSPQDAQPSRPFGWAFEAAISTFFLLYIWGKIDPEIWSKSGGLGRIDIAATRLMCGYRDCGLATKLAAFFAKPIVRPLLLAVVALGLGALFLGLGALFLQKYKQR